jgi:hypothetical protein
LTIILYCNIYYEIQGIYETPFQDTYTWDFY